jgi:hypothetical protein
MDKKIFWLEDRPDCSAVVDIEMWSDGGITPKTLLCYTDFVYDIKSGEELFKSKKKYDLYVIDCDLPNVMEPSQKARVDAFSF